MKTLIPIPKFIALAFVALAIALWVATPSPAAAQEKGAAAAKLIKLAPAPNSVAVAVKPADKPANWCSKCKISQVRVAERSIKTGAAPESKLITRNECSKCANVLATAGTGKLAKATFASSCEECCKMDPECCEKNPICCIANAAASLARPPIMARN